MPVNLFHDFSFRLAAAKDAAASAHRQTVAKLRRALMEEDKLFQQTQQRERAEHDAAMVGDHLWYQYNIEF